MRRPFLVVLLAAVTLWLAGCGYSGPNRPPSLHIPVDVTDFSAHQNGAEIAYNFTLPELTTDGATIGDFESIQISIGPDLQPFDFGTWIAQSKEYRVPDPQIIAGTNGKVDLRRIEASLPSANWTGKNVAIAVRTAQRPGRLSGWSNIVHIKIVDAPETPQIQVASDPKGVKVTIAGDAKPHISFRILRQSADTPQATDVGTTDTNEFVDTSAEYGKPYQYTAVAFNNEQGASAESKPSAAVSITAIDKFPPATPTNVNALPSGKTVEISWERNTETDIKGYYVYRSVDGGAFTRQGELLTLPAYSDKDVQPGRKYAYAVSAVDQRDLESERSKPVDASF
jgi:predicted small lipoprotein YifL